MCVNKTQSLETTKIAASHHHLLSIQAAFALSFCHTEKMQSTHQNEIKSPTWNAQIWQLRLVGAKPPKCLSAASVTKSEVVIIVERKIHKMMLCLKLMLKVKCKACILCTRAHIHTRYILTHTCICKRAWACTNIVLLLCRKQFGAHSLMYVSIGYINNR